MENSLEKQLFSFKNSRFLAMPIAGTLAWCMIGLAGAFLPPASAALAIFIGTGMIFYLAIFIARFTGEDLLGKKRKGNFFDQIFLLTIGMAILVYAIAIPFYFLEPSSLPLSVGILTGLMWLPFSGLIQHWVGIFHAIARTGLIVLVWYSFPSQRFVSIPLVIVGVYLVTIYILTSRYAKISQAIELRSE